ncbi:MAG: penicillin-binding protein 2 [Nitrosomonadales bacterium]|nr:penicillin-binding protein 2 [Nitrosomonadales bacterium]
MKRHIEFKDTQREIHYFRLRLALSLGFVLLLLLILLARFVYLQVMQQSHYQTLAENNRISIVPIAPSRGLILDRNGVILAHNYSAYTLEITLNKVADLKATIDELAKLIDIQPGDRKRFKRLLADNRKFESLPIRNRLTDDEVARFSAQRYRFPGVEIKARLFREYPYHEQISHLVGYIGRINEGEAAQLEEDEMAANYRGSDYIGKTGIERSYEGELHGKTEVLAFVSKPGYDPNLFIDGIDEQSWNELNNSPDVPLNNRALRGQYSPGSTIKPFMALAGLHYNKRAPSYTISDPGYFSLPGSRHRYRDWKKEGHGSVDLFKSIVVSCDTYYYGLATELGIDNIYSLFSEFGFGKKTGIDMEGEVSGLMPSPEWKQKRYKQRWYAGDTVSVGIGQGYNLVTPLQLAYATATLANDGVAYRPHLLKEVQISRTNEKRTLATTPESNLNLNSEHLALVKSAMVAVTQPGGTAAKAGADAPYTFAGKTGTAQVIGIKQGEKYIESKIQERHRDHAWFMAFAPSDQPKIALAVLVENGGHGSSTAAPIARKVLDYFLLGKMPQPLLIEDDAEGVEHD